MLVAFIWGFAFVGQSAGGDLVGPFFFIGARMLLGAITLSFPLLYNWNKKKKELGESYRRSTLKEYCAENKTLIKGGLVCGTILFLASGTQQVALILEADVFKAGFLTTLYVVIVPVVGIFMHKATHWNTWVSVAIAVVGLYFLTIADTLILAPEDTILIVGAFFWAFHIIAIDHYAPKVNVINLTLIQFVLITILGFLLAPILDPIFGVHLTVNNLVAAIPSLLWVGVLSSGVAFTLQALGQKNANPTAAAIILSLEAVFSLVGGVLLLSESFTAREGLGCILMFAAVILAQIPVKGRSHLQ